MLVNSGRFDVFVVTSDGVRSNAGILIILPVLKHAGGTLVSQNQATFEVTGVGFVPADYVAITWNGTILQLPTTFSSSTRLIATLTPSATAIRNNTVVKWRLRTAPEALFFHTRFSLDRRLQPCRGQGRWPIVQLARFGWTLPPRDVGPLEWRSSFCHGEHPVPDNCQCSGLSDRLGGLC